MDFKFRMREISLDHLTFTQYVMGETRIIGLCENEQERDRCNRLLNQIACALDE